MPPDFLHSALFFVDLTWPAAVTGPVQAKTKAKASIDIKILISIAPLFGRDQFASFTVHAMTTFRVYSGEVKAVNSKSFDVQIFGELLPTRSIE